MIKLNTVKRIAKRNSAWTAEVEELIMDAAILGLSCCWISKASISAKDSEDLIANGFDLDYSRDEYRCRIRWS